MVYDIVVLNITVFALSLVFLYLYVKSGGIGVWREDHNKYIKRMVLTGGGIPILSSALIMYMAMLVYFSDHQWFFISISITTFIGMILGLYDDMADIKVWKKVPLMLIPPIPMMFMGLISPLWDHTTVLWIDFGVLYWLLVIPVAYMGFSNGANIIAGYDALEGGIYLLILFLYIIIGVITNKGLVLLLSFPLFFAVMAFEIYSLPPSKVLLGNVGSFPIGGLLGIIPLIGHFEIVLPVVFLPHLVEFFFKLKYRGHTSVFGIVDDKGIIHNKSEIKSVLHWLISWGNMSEKKITIAMLGIESLLCTMAFFIWYLSVILH